MTLNIWEDPNYVLLLKYKGTDTLIKRDIIYDIFNKERVFIPNVDGILCNNNGTIISPTRLWMKWDEIPNWVLYSDMLKTEYLDSSKETIPTDDICRFYNEKYLIFRQRECIHWLMYEKFIIANNKETYDIFQKAYGNTKQFGKNNDSYPTIQDYVTYIQEVGYSLGMPKVIEPHFMTILVMISKLKAVVFDLVEQGKYSLDQIHPSIKHLFDENETVKNKSSVRRQNPVYKKN